MTLSISRRGFVLGLGAAVAAWSTSKQARAAADSNVSLADIEARFGGRLGVFAMDTGSGRTLRHRADERFLMCSTFKGLLAGQVLSRIDRGHENPSRQVQYGQKDILFTSPVTQAHVVDGTMSVAALCQAMVEQSDNTAAVLLMRESGGPEALTRFLRGLGDEVTRSDRYEPQSNDHDGALDTTSPRAIAGGIRALLFGNVLSITSSERLRQWMIATTPGLRRIRAVLPEKWIAGDRPGTNDQDETNDVAFVTRPGRAPLVVAVYYHAPGLAPDMRERVMREAGLAFMTWARNESAFGQPG